MEEVYMERRILEILSAMQKDIKDLKEGQERVEKNLDKVTELLDYVKGKRDNYVYPSIFEIDEDGIGVTFPDLPGAITCGDNIDEAIKNAKECMGLHLFGMERDNEIIPDPTLNPKEIKLEKNQYLMLIEVYMPPIREDIIKEREKRKKR